MIFLNHLNLPSAGTQNFTEGIDKLFVYVAQEIPIFIPMVLFALAMIIFVSGITLQRRNEGTQDTAMWAAIAMYITSTAALIMTLSAGLINLFTLVTTLTITIAVSVWFFMSKDS